MRATGATAQICVQRAGTDQQPNGFYTTLNNIFNFFTHRLRLHTSSTVPDPRKIYAPADFTM